MVGTPGQLVDGDVADSFLVLLLLVLGFLLWIEIPHRGLSGITSSILRECRHCPIYRVTNCPNLRRKLAYFNLHGTFKNTTYPHIDVIHHTEPWRGRDHGDELLPENRPHESAI